MSAVQLPRPSRATRPNATIERRHRPERASGILAAIAVPAVALYGVAAYLHRRLWRLRPSLMLLAMLSAFVLLSEAMVAVVFARNWSLSWWEWHLLLIGAFGLVAAGARIQWHEERFADLYLDDTLSGDRVLSVLFADLQGFTSFSEQHEPAEVTAMLNTMFEVAVPSVVRGYGGTVDRIIGDALMGRLKLKGRTEPLQTYLLVSLELEGDTDARR